MAEAVYFLCALASLFCAVLLVRGYRRQPTRLIMWSSLCFTGLAINNGLLVVDLVLVPYAIDLSLVRALVSVGAIVTFLIALIWEPR